MEQTIMKTTHFCGCCKQELPLANFYFNSKKQCPDNYCKACRKRSSRKQRKELECSRIVNKPHCYLVLTKVAERELRIKLIRHAQQVVNESIARKRRKLKEALSD